MNRVTQNTRQERIYGNMEAKVFLAVSWYELFFVADEFKLRPKEKEFVVLVISAYHSGINDYLSDKFKDYMSPNFTLSISDYMTRAKKKQWLQVSSTTSGLNIYDIVNCLNYAMCARVWLECYHGDWFL